MQQHTSANGFGGVSSAILILSLLTIVALGFPQAIPCSAANADNLTGSLQPGVALGTTSKPDDAARLRVSEAYGKLPLFLEANRGPIPSVPGADTGRG